jgi:hypothetical protein
VTRSVVLKANLPTSTARTFAKIILAACTTCGTYYVKTHNLIGCTEGADGQTFDKMYRQCSTTDFATIGC